MILKMKCSCGAQFQGEDEYAVYVTNEASQWRQDHLHCIGTYQMNVKDSLEAMEWERKLHQGKSLDAVGTTGCKASVEVEK